MTQPSVLITELDGALGVLPPSAGRLLAVIGPAAGGPFNVPATYGKVKDFVGAFVGGPGVEAAAYAMDRYGKPVVFVRTETPTDADATPIEAQAVGTSVVTLGATLTPMDDYELVLSIVAGGTVGTTGITYKYSLDGGRTMSATQALGTATSIAVPDSGGLTLELAAGTLVAGDRYTSTITAARWDAATLGAALTALSGSVVQWEIAEIVGPIDGDSFDTVDAAFQGLFNVGKYRAWVGNTRIPDPDETEAEYLADLSTVFATKASVFGSLYAGGCKLVSSISGRKYARQVSVATAPREQSVSEEVDIADVGLGTLPGLAIRDANGNVDPQCHDESWSPGLDDARFAVLRTWDGLAGVYVNRPRVFSAEGSDFRLMPHRRVINLAHAALRQYFIRRLNRPILLNRDTGLILESEALEIEAGATSAMASVLLAKPKASGVQFRLSRFDNVIATQTLTGDARVLPLGYPEYIDLTVGYYSPALITIAAAAA